MFRVHWNSFLSYKLFKKNLHFCTKLYHFGKFTGHFTLQVFENLYSMSLRYARTDGDYKESAQRLTNSLGNVRYGSLD